MVGFGIMGGVTQGLWGGNIRSTHVAFVRLSVTPARFFILFFFQRSIICSSHYSIIDRLGHVIAFYTPYSVETEIHPQMVLSIIVLEPKFTRKWPLYIWNRNQPADIKPQLQISNRNQSVNDSRNRNPSAWLLQLV